MRISDWSSDVCSSDLAKKLVVNSTKSMTGHLLGAAGGIEAVFTTLAVYNQKSPPTINIFNQDPECDLDYCANEARDMKIDVAISNSLGVGGPTGSMQPEERRGGKVRVSTYRSRCSPDHQKKTKKS